MRNDLRHRNLLFADDLGPVIVNPGQHDRTGFRRLELELDIRVRRDRRLEVGREHLLTGDRTRELVDRKSVV